MMKKWMMLAFAACCCLGLSAQESLRYNYVRNGYTYTAAERSRIDGTTTLYVKLSRVLFSDGQPVYKLRLDVEDSAPWKMPKNAPLTITTTAGRTVIVKNSASEPNRVAPDGIQGEKSRLWWNYGEYYLEEADLKKIAAGVSAVDITKRWSSDGAVKVAYKNNEFGAAVAAQYDAIRQAPAPVPDVSGLLRSLQDRGGSRLAETNALDVNDAVGISLVYFYYAEHNTEGYDLNFYFKGVTVPYGASVTVETADGNRIELHQEKDLAAGRAICYPENADLKKMLAGVRKITVQTTGDPLELNFSDAAFSKVLNRLYNALQTIAIL